MEENNMFQSRVELQELNNSVRKIESNINKVIVGQKEMIDLLLVSILSDGHVLIEGVPGVAKTLTAKLIARSVSVAFSRIQFTPDLMPSDVLGTMVFHANKSEFVFNKGPIFSNIILIDEINRAPAKTQSALFEVMEERQASIDGVTYAMDEPFLVFATQNPIEHEGTYRLPEAQLDRFLFKIKVDYPKLEEEMKIIADEQNRKGKPKLQEVGPVLKGEDIKHFQQKAREIHIEEKLMGYIAQIVDKTRKSDALFLGASPRASLNILTAAKAYAAIQGRDFVTPDDIIFVAYPVLRHRIILTPEKEMEGITTDIVIKQIIKSIEIPR